MSLQPGDILLYGATSHDFEMAMAAAGATGIPLSQVSGDYTTAWNSIAAGGHFVVAVGGAALNALYYNSCGWQTPTGTAAGHTPFALWTGSADALPGTNEFVNGAGYLAQDTFLAVVLIIFYALHGHYPTGLQSLPKLLTPTDQCPNGAQNPVRIPC